MRQFNGNQDNSDDDEATLDFTFVLPIKNPYSREETEQLFLKERPNYNSTSDYTQRVVQNATISVHTTGDTPLETIEGITQRSGIHPDEDLTRAAECAAFWKAAGADTLIFVCSFGVDMVANGLIIRFTGINPLVSTLLWGGVTSISFSNMQILFNSLIKPPGENIPEDRQARYAMLNKYALLPISFVITAGISGTILSSIGDTSFGTQQAISAGITPLVGPIMATVRHGIRKCHQGSLVLSDDRENVSGAFSKAYSQDPNPLDSSRSYRYGLARDMIGRLFGITSCTLMLSYGGAFELKNYCIPVSGQPQNVSSGGNIPGDCLGGNLTYMFRELGISFGYAIGYLIVEPAFTALTNRLYDYFYPPFEEVGDENIRLEEIDDEPQ